MAATEVKVDDGLAEAAEGIVHLGHGGVGRGGGIGQLSEDGAIGSGEAFGERFAGLRDAADDLLEEGAAEEGVGEAGLLGCG
ncbi:MAG: hypothetical protein M5U12_31645 [Verrucomicrobia bacterium]|nr:hypothetical protein [Verrucomicrobiota bacterium]